MAVGKAGPTIHHREPAGRRRQHRHGGGRARACRRLHAPAGGCAERNATLYDKLSFNFLRDIAPVAGIIRECPVLVVHPSFPAKTVPEFIAYAKANPGKISMASPGNGSTPHVTGELFKMTAGIDMIHVPYRGGGQVMTDLIAGQVQLSFIGLTVAMEHIRSGKVRALAVTTATRSDVLPDIPTVGEFVPGYEATAWFGIGAPGKTPTEIIDKLNTDINAGLRAANIKPE
jgi:tripartite-type tricarboxylate transporter receptor subunit TctC